MQDPVVMGTNCCAVGRESRPQRLQGLFVPAQSVEVLREVRAREKRPRILLTVGVVQMVNNLQV